MDIAYQVEVENELRSMGSEQLRKERSDISKELKSLQDQIGDLAFNNYRTYADAGRTTQDCTEIFTEMSDKLRDVTGEVASLQQDMRSFQNTSTSLEHELETIRAACSSSSPLWEVMSLPARMDVCIRSGYYEAAYSLTNYGMMMQQHSMVNNPLLKTVADRLVDARSLLLEELFNKFSGPLDLAASLQVVNNVRKMPYLTPTQLRVSILQHKDMYMEKQLLDIATHPDFALAAIDVYRTCMHDTLVLYLSVFPENESTKKDPSIDPRWEQWAAGGPSSVLGQWAGRNIQRLLDLIHRTEMKSGVDMASVWSKTMSLAATFGRMGLDFRPLIVQSLTTLVADRFRTAVRQATNRLVSEVKHLSIVSGEIGGGFEGEATAGSAPSPSPEISMWDDICVYGNDMLNALNGMRYSHTPMLVAGIMSALRDSLLSVLSWLAAFHQSAAFPRAVRVLCLQLAPFLCQSVRYLFPFSVVSRLFGSSISKQQYDSLTELDMREVAASCDGSERIESVLLPLLQKKKIDLDAVMRKPAERYGSAFDAIPAEVPVPMGPESVVDAVPAEVVVPSGPEPAAGPVLFEGGQPVDNDAFNDNDNPSNDNDNEPLLVVVPEDSPVDRNAEFVPKSSPAVTSDVISGEVPTTVPHVLLPEYQTEPETLVENSTLPQDSTPLAHGSPNVISPEKPNTESLPVEVASYEPEVSLVPMVPEPVADVVPTEVALVQPEVTAVPSGPEQIFDAVPTEVYAVPSPSEPVADVVQVPLEDEGWGEEETEWGWEEKEETKAGKKD